jgi:sRNA-binding regulator protein Hfq
MDTKPPNPPKQKQGAHREYDSVAKRLRDDHSAYLLTVDGRRVGPELVGEGRYTYYLEDKTGLAKTDCVGAFPPDIDSLIASKGHPVRQVSVSRAERFNEAKMRVLYPEHRLGLSLKVILVNGWELVGKIETARQFFVELRLSEEKTVHLYRHAIFDYEWADGEPPAVSPEQERKTQQQRKALLTHPNQTKKKAQSVVAPTPVPKVEAKSAVPVVWYEPLLTLWREQNEAERTIMNAKLKLVLREIPPTLREVGDAVWLPLQNQPKDVPGGFELSSMPVELVITKKMWKGALKKAQEQKQQTGNEAIYIFEALIGMHQNRFCALVSGIQLAESKPKTIGPKSPPTSPSNHPEAKPAEPQLTNPATQERPVEPQVPKPVAQTKPVAAAQVAKPSATKKPIMPVVEVIKRPELKPAPEEKPVMPAALEAKPTTVAKEEKPQETATPPKEPETTPEAKPKKRVFDMTADEPLPTTPTKTKSPKAKK